MVKMCDRITNLQPAPSGWDEEKNANYSKEAQIILEELGESNLYLATRLAKKIEMYNS